MVLNGTMPLRRPLLLLTILLAVASCDESGSGAAVDTALRERQSFAAPEASQPDVAQVEAAGSLAFEDYEQAVLQYRECMEAAGFVFAEFEYRPSSRVYEWLVNSDGSEPAAATCYGAFEAYDMGWQRQVAALTSDEVRQRLERCLRDAGVPFDEDASQGELGVLLAERGIQSWDC